MKEYQIKINVIPTRTTFLPQQQNRSIRSRDNRLAGITERWQIIHFSGSGRSET